MPITLTCSRCEKPLTLKDDLAGKRIRCPDCREILAVPAPGAPPPKPPVRRSSPSEPQRKVRDNVAARITIKAIEGSSEETGASALKGRIREPSPEVYNARYQKLINGFAAEEIEPVPMTGTYRFGILLVSLFMISLPFLYLAVVIVLSFVSPPLLWIPLLLFLIVKPLFSLSSDPSGTRTLDRDEEPLLFDFVDRVCEAVDAPYPKQINIDASVNASASFRRGVLSMFGDDLTLTIGMPLITGLNTREFAGVLAHEFGHFAQGAGMRLTYLIRFVSMWFTKVVYERDRLDGWLETCSQATPIPICLIFYGLRLLVWLGRRVIWLFMMAGHLIAGYMLRQMEFDADRHEARLAGSRCFAETNRKIIHMAVAHQGAIADLQEFYSEGRLADNLPRLIIANVDQLNDKARKKIREHVTKTETGLFDTHPCDRERVKQVKREAAEGIFRIERPAENLFRRYDFQARAVTWDMYKDIFGKDLKKSDIHPVEQLLARQAYQQENYKALFRFFQCAPSWYRPLRNPKAAVTAPSNEAAAMARSKDAREKMLRLAPGYAVAWKKYDKSDTRLIECDMAMLLLKSRLNVPKTLFKVPMRSIRDVEAREDAANYIQAKQEPKLAPFEDAAAQRLYSALRLLRGATVQDRIAHHADLTAEVDQLVELFGEINSRLGQLLEIRNDQIALGLLISMLDGNDGNRRLITRIFDTMANLHDLVHDLYESLCRVPYPFDHANEFMTVGEFMLSSLPEEENPSELYEAANAIGNSLPAIQSRVLGRMCQIAEEVETALGYEVLPQPDIEDDDDEDEEE